MADDMTASLRERATKAAQDWAPNATVANFEPLTGGTSSLTFVADVRAEGRSQEQVVLKVAPPGLAPVRNRDVLRQGRVMRALYRHEGVRVPPVLFEDAGDPPETPPFVAMGLVPGECIEPILEKNRDPARFADVRARALDGAAVLAAIHAVPPEQAGLGDETVVSLVDEIDRWTRAFSTVPSDLQNNYGRCARKLHATVPDAVAPVINHGDYRLGNTLCQGGRVEAVIDWEIWSVGDPRVDLSWFVFFTDEARHPAAPSDDPTGMPTGAELLAAYAEACGRELPDLVWFEALTCYKEAAATALLIKRGLRHGDLSPAMERMIPALPELLAKAEVLLGELERVSATRADGR